MLKHKILSEQLVSNSFIGTTLDYQVKHAITKEIKTYTVNLIKDWVNVIAETPDHKLVLVEQWRAGVNDLSIELPGGKIDDGEEPIKAGLRELLEETGYGPTEKSKIVYSGYVHANPAIQTNKMHFVYVNNVEKNDDTNFDEFELVYTHVYDKQKVKEMLSSHQITHAYAVIGLLKAMGC